MKTFNINGEKFKVTKEIINQYHEAHDQYLFLVDSMVDQGLDIGVEYIDEHPKTARQVERAEDYIISMFWIANG